MKLLDNLQEIKVDKETNLVPENLKRNISCLGIDGTYMDVKEFADVDEMNNDTEALEGDLAIVYDKDSTFNGLYKYDEKSKTYKLTDNQFDLDKEFVYNATYYGPKGVEEGTMQEFSPSNYNNLIKYFEIYDGLKNNIKINFNGSFRYRPETSLPPKLTLTSRVTDAYSMFYDRKDLTTFDLSDSDTSNITTMKYMFYGCNNMESLDLSNFNTSKVIDMGSMFSNCSKLESLDLSHFNTSKVTYMSQMFYKCKALTSLDLSNFDTSKVTSIKDMFYNCSSLTSLDLSNFDLSSIDVTDQYHPGGLFYGCSSLTSLNTSNWDTSNFVYMRDTFGSCSSLTSLDISNWDVSNVRELQGTFRYCNSLETLDLSTWNTSNVTNMSSMIFNDYSLTSINLTGKFNTSKVTSFSNMFYNCNKLATIDLSNFDTSNATSFTDMFCICSGLTTLDVSHFNTSKATSLNSMFYRCNSLTSLDVSNWDTSNVTDMYGIFTDCYLLPEIDVSKWNTSKVTNMSHTFRYCKSLTSLDVSNWDTSNVTTFDNFLCTCSSLVDIDISNFNLQSATNMKDMFINCDVLSTESIRSILKALPTATSLAPENKTLRYLSLDVSLREIAISLPEWEACVEAGWGDREPNLPVLEAVSGIQEIWVEEGDIPDGTIIVPDLSTYLVDKGNGNITYTITNQDEPYFKIEGSQLISYAEDPDNYVSGSRLGSYNITIQATDLTNTVEFTLLVIVPAYPYRSFAILPEEVEQREYTWSVQQNGITYEDNVTVEFDSTGRGIIYDSDMIERLGIDTYSGFTIQLLDSTNNIIATYEYTDFYNEKEITLIVV